jgi:hypothetical protein
MRGSNSELNPGAPGQWITNPSHFTCSQIVFFQNPKFEESRLKNGEKIGERQTDGRTGLMNSTEHIFSEICSKNII